MTRMKRILAVFLSMVLIISCSIPVLAENVQEAQVYTEGFHVMLNGEYVQFTDATPVNKQGRIMVPFRAILEALGAKVDWIEETRTVTAKTDDTFISFRVGQPNIDVTRNGERSVKVMDVVPYIDPALGRTYVSTRFVSEALGFTVGWDAEDQTAVIIDFDSLYRDADKIFSNYDALMESAAREPGQSYRIQDKIVSREELSDAVVSEITTEEDSVLRDDNGSGTRVIELDMGQMIQGLFEGTGEGWTEEDLELLAQLDRIEMELIREPKTGKVWMKSLANELLFGEDLGDVWIHMDPEEVFGSDVIRLPGLDRPLQGASLSMKERLMQQYKESGDDMPVSLYGEVTEQYQLLQTILGNGTLKKTTSQGVTRYQAQLDPAKVTDRGTRVSGTLVFTDDGKGGITCKGELTITDPANGSKRILTIDHSSSKTGSSPAALPEGDRVINVEDLVEEL